MRTVLRLIGGLALAASTIIPSPATPSAGAVNGASLQSLTYDGTGCPQGTVGQSVSADRQTFTLIFDSYIASTGTGVSHKDAKKDCDLTLNIEVGPGYRLDYVQLDRRGYVQLTSEQTAVAVVDDPSGPKDKVVATGPTARDYLERSEAAPKKHQKGNNCESGVFALKVKTSERINGDRNLSGQITTDSFDGKVFAVAC